MCINETTSWITLVLATCANITCCMIISLMTSMHDRKVPILLIAAWQYAIFMQLPEAMIWHHSGSDEWALVAFILNVTQPFALLIAGLIVMHVCESNATERLQSNAHQLPCMASHCRWIFPLVSAIAYSALVIASIPDCTFKMKIETCTQLSLTWWKTCLSGWPLYLYFSTSVLCFGMLPMRWAILNTIAWGTTLAVSKVYYEDCAVGSMWCWMVTITGPLIFIMAVAFHHFQRVAPVRLISTHTL